MFNVGGGEVLVILLLALIVLGPDKLPDFARKAGTVMREVRRVSSGFQAEIRQALEEEPQTPSEPPEPMAPPEAAKPVEHEASTGSEQGPPGAPSAG